MIDEDKDLGECIEDKESVRDYAEVDEQKLEEERQYKNDI